MGMTIDRAIAHARDVAKRRIAEYENHYDKDAHYYPRQCKKCAEEHEQLAEWLEELKQYREIGTVEECRESVGKQTAKKPQKNGLYSAHSDIFRKIPAYTCPSCGNMCLEKWATERSITSYCWDCGQKLDWGDE